MRPDLDAIRARKKAAEFSSNPADHVRSSRDVPVLLDYIQRLETVAKRATQSDIWACKWVAEPGVIRQLRELLGGARGGC